MNVPRNVVRCRPVHLEYLAARMREDEIEQFLAFTGYDHYEPEYIIEEVEAMAGPKFTVLQSDGYPAAAGGYFYVGKHVWQSWMIGTMEGWEKNWRSLTKGTRWLMDALLCSGAKKLQTRVIMDRTNAMEWYARGLRMECDRILPRFAGGRDVAQFVRFA